MMTQEAIAQPSTPTTASEVLNATPETKVDAPAVAPTHEKLSPKLNILLQREKAAVQRESSARAKEAEIDAKLKALDERLARVDQFESIKKTNPLKALDALGMSYDDLTKATLSDGEVPAEVRVKQLDEKFSNYVKNQEQALQREAEEAKTLAQRKEESTITEFKSEIVTYVKDNAARYEFIEFDQAQDLVYDVVDEHYNRTINPTTGIGEVLTIAKAADKVEEFLEKKYQKAPALSKFKAFLSAPQASTKVAPKPLSQNLSQKPKTLTNNMSATQSPTKIRTLTDEERVQKAIAYARGLRPA